MAVPTGPKLEAELALWMAHERGWSRWTRTTYLGCIGLAQRSVKGRTGRNLLHASREDLVGFLATARHPRTRNVRLRALRAFFRFARERGYRRTDPTGDIERVREPQLLPRPRSRQEALRLLRAAPAVGPRAVALVALMLYAGLRRGEARALRWADVDLEAETLRILGKWARERVIPVHPQLEQALRAWRARPDGGADYVFPSPYREGRPISENTVAREIADAAAAAGLGHCNPHSLRHTAATELLRAGSDLRRVQVFLGHASPTSTAIYTKVLLEDLEADLSRLDYARP